MPCAQIATHGWATTPPLVPEPDLVAVESVLGAACAAVRVLWFDKTPAANWRVTWHQDLTIAVAARRDVDGYGPWSDTDGVVPPCWHVSRDALHLPRGDDQVVRGQGDRSGQHAIAVNDQWRICFRFVDGDAYDVEICDYH